MRRIFAGATFGALLAAAAVAISGGGYTPPSSGGGGAHHMAAFHGAAGFNAVDSWNETTTWSRATTIDAFLKRDGTTLTAWVGIGGSVPRQAGSWTVTAGAGLVGWRIESTSSSNLIVTAFAELSEVPGL